MDDSERKPTGSLKPSEASTQTLDAYEIIADLDAAGDKALLATIERILAKRAAAAEAARVAECLPDGFTKIERSTGK